MENPYILDEIRQQGGPKYMVSVMIIDGQILEPFWFVDSEGVSFNQTGDVYRKMLEEHYVPILLSKFGRRGLRKYWFQQDGLNMKYLFVCSLCVKGEGGICQRWYYSVLCPLLGWSTLEHQMSF